MNIEQVIKKILNYSFQPVLWDYDNLTKEEKKLFTKQEFEKLKQIYKT